MKTTCVFAAVCAVLVAAGGCGGGSDIEADRAAVQAVLDATMGNQAIELPVRCSWILEKRGTNWLIVHFHKSVGMTG
jgi:hypothetical protein